MTSTTLINIYDAIAAPKGDYVDAPLFSAKVVPDQNCYLVGKDVAGQACLLVETTDEGGRKPPPVRLENLNAQFELACQITEDRGQIRIGSFTVVRCLSQDIETIHYFLSVCEIFIRYLGDSPSRNALAAAVWRIASIFQNINKPPIRSLNGLFGELFVISQSRSPLHAVAAWRNDENSRFDFSTGDVRIEVKSCAGRVRSHTFSYDQCCPPPNTHAVVASMMVERIPGGISIEGLMASIEASISGSENLVLKLHEKVASTLGADLNHSLQVTFDLRLSESSLKWFDLRKIPAVRCTLPTRVSNVHFVVNLSKLNSLKEDALVDRDPQFWELMPQG